MHEELVTFIELIGDHWYPAESYNDLILGWKAALERESPHFTEVAFMHTYNGKVTFLEYYYLYNGRFLTDRDENEVWNCLESEFSWEPNDE